MPEMVKPVAEWCAAIIEVLGISIIMLVALYSLGRSIVLLIQTRARRPVLHDLRQRVGEGILLGLEFLIAADIIYTVALDLTFESLGALAIVVLIRTFLSFTLEVELTGRWPWQDKPIEQPIQT